MFLIASNSAHAQEELDALVGLSLKDLQNVSITSVSKKQEDLFNAPGSVYVLTSEDISRSGATTIPDALRMVPGLEVASIDGNKWAITARGFNRQFVNKLLVLIDGRSVYTPLFSGTYWDNQDMVLADIERIEIIRGPGATLWGANAVNGVINIITKNAELTQGNYVSTIYGNYDRTSVETRHGGRTDSGIAYRVDGKYTNRDETKRPNGIKHNDSGDFSKAGFRADWESMDSDAFSVIGDIHSGKQNRDYFFPSRVSAVAGIEDFSGGNLTFKWDKKISDNSSSTTQFYVDHILRDMQYVLDQERTTVDFDFQHNWTPSKNHDIVWGIGYRHFKDDYTSIDYEGITYLDYTPDETYNSLYSAFFQDKINLIDDVFFLTLGSKFEHNFYTDFEYQPNARLSWIVDDSQFMWLSVSRAVRIPSRGERGINLRSTYVGNGNFVSLVGNPSFDSEDLIAYEFGYRTQPKPWATFDISLFYNDYNNLRSFEPNGTLNVPVGNKGSGEVAGIEFASRWLLNEDWNLFANSVFQSFNLSKDSDSKDNITERTEEGTSPDYQFMVMSRYNIQEDLYFDNNLYYTSKLFTPNIDSRLRFDTRISWKPFKGYELSLVGQNLLDDGHREFNPFLFSVPTEVPRSFYGKVAINF